MRDRRLLLLDAAVWITIGLVVAGLVLLYPYGGPPPAAQEGFAATEEGEQWGGVVTAVREVGVTDQSLLLPGARDVQVDVRLDDGTDMTVDMIDETGVISEGRAVVVARISAPGTPEQFAIVDFRRGGPLIVLALVFIGAVIALGRWQGARALVGLSLCGAVIVGFTLPALLSGRGPTGVAVVTALAVMLLTLPLSHGWTATTKAAIIGTSVALLVTVGLAQVAVDATALTGLASEDVQFVRFASGREIDLRGLLLAGIIVGTLGVLDDVTVSQASTAAALRRADPGASVRRIFGEALSVGRDHVAATVNTLFLAYAGAALPLLLLFSIGQAPLTETVTSELVAQEVVRTIVGSIGLIVAVPFTTAVAAAALQPQPPGGVPGPGEPVRTPTQPLVGADDGRSSTVADGGEPSEAEEWEARLRRKYGLE